MAAPVGGQVLSEVLPYLEVEKTENKEEEKKEMEVPEIQGKTVKEAKEILKMSGFEMEIEENNTDSQNAEEKNTVDISSFVVKKQFPKAGIKLLEGKKVRAQIEEEKSEK